MDWIKVTPETMPPDGAWVLVTSVWRGQKSVEYAQYENGEFLGEVEGCMGDRWEIEGGHSLDAYAKPSGGLNMHTLTNKQYEAYVKMLRDKEGGAAAYS